MNDPSVRDALPSVETEGLATRPVLLSQAREIAGLHITALAAALKVPVKKLEALEAGRYEELPDLVFARALASSACRHLKVDPAPILQQIPVGVIPQLGEMGTAINTPFKPTFGGSPANPVGWVSRPAVLASLALVGGALLLVFLPNMTPFSEPVANPPVADLLPRESPLPVSLAPDKGSLDSAAVLLQPQTPAGIEGTLPPVLVPIPTTTTEQTTSQVSDATVSTSDILDANKVLAIRATGESWIQVLDGTGTVLVQRMLNAGDVVDFTAAPPYAVVVGRVDNAQVQVHGRIFDAKPFSRNGVARFEVK
jgi:cytoskeleton protein RodZ